MAGTSVELKWGDGEYTFRLRVREIEELQRLCGINGEPVGIGTISARLFNRTFFVADLYHVIRLGLIGGGTTAVRAKQLVDTYVDGCPIARPGDASSPLSTAQAVMTAAFFGWEVESVDEKKQPAAEQSTSRPSKRSASKSDGRQPRSKKRPSPTSTPS